MLKAGYIRHTVHKLTFSEQCYYVFGDFYAQGTHLTTRVQPENFHGVKEGRQEWDFFAL